MANFEIKHRDGLARIGVFHTAHGKVETPTLLPVINPNLAVISPKEMKELFGTQMVITNSYIIKRTETLRKRALDEGLHALIDFDGPIMTDSGTFQSHMYGEVDLHPDEIVAFQRDIGSDIGTILDIFTEPYHTKQEVRGAIDETLARAKTAVNFAGEMELALPVQGGVYPELREYCAKMMNNMQAGIHPIGGIVPLMEDYRYGDVLKAVLHAKKRLKHNRPVHLFGCGHPMFFPLAALAGCDLFDSASYIKYARDGRMMFPGGTKHLQNMTELPCNCLVCRENTVDSLLSMETKERSRSLALHNLSVSFTEIRHVREAIREGRIWELACERSRAHPKLLEALASLRRHSPWMENFTPTSRPKGMMYTGIESFWRPEVYHVLDRLFSSQLYDKDTYYLIPFKGGDSLEWALKNKDLLLQVFHKENKGILVDSILGPVPLELLECYPFGGMILPTVPPELEKSFYPSIEGRRSRMLSKILEMGKDVEPWDDIFEDEAEEIDPVKRAEILEIFNQRRMKFICDYQFFPGAGDILLNGEIRLVRSKKTGKVRNVFCDEEHILSLRAEDGLFTLKIPGARKLAEKGKGCRIVVDSESGVFNREGKNVMAKFVLLADEGMNPGDEVYVIDDNDILLAVGKALLTAIEIKDFSRGVAVKVRDGVGAPSIPDQ